MPDLEVISRHSDFSELSSIAHDLRVCIATLGAVWFHSTPSVDETSTRSILNISKPTTYSGIPKPPMVHDQEETLPKVLSDIQESLNDPLIPVKGHGLIELARLVETRHSCCISHHELILTILADHLQHDDSYIYMAAIRGLLAMSSINLPKLVSLLCRQYTTGNPDTLLMDKCAIEKIMKVGEALVKVTSSLGDMLPFYCDQLVTAFLTNARHTEQLVRTSALSNLAEICGQTMLWKVENEVSILC